MLIRKFEAKDSDDVALLIKRNLVEVNSKYYHPLVIEKLVKDYESIDWVQLAREREILIAEEYGTVVGTANLLDNTIRDVFVDPGRLGRGIGKKLMNHTEQLLQEKGYKNALLYASTTANGFYLSTPEGSLRSVTECCESWG